MKKVVIIGTGNVGAHIASAMVHRNLPVELRLIDLDQKFETAQVLDLKDSLLFSPNAHVAEADFGDKAVTEADIFVITAGAKQKTNETRLDLLGRNISILKSIAKSIGKIKKSAIVILISNPVDILAQAASEIFDLPRGHVFGTGTLLDTSRLRWRLAEQFGKNIQDVNGYVLGEHGDSEFIAWSTVTGGRRAQTFCDGSEKCVRNAAYEIIEGKGATYFGIGAATAEILCAILGNEKKVLPVSAPLSGEYKISGIAVGVPCIIGKHGVEEVVEIKLPEDELKKLQDSAGKLKKMLV